MEQEEGAAQHRLDEQRAVSKIDTHTVKQTGNKTGNEIGKLSDTELVYKTQTKQVDL